MQQPPETFRLQTVMTTLVSEFPCLVELQRKGDLWTTLVRETPRWRSATSSSVSGS